MRQGARGVEQPTFKRDFAILTGHQPMPWQRRLYAGWFAEGRIPDALDLPTGLGKTSVMAIWHLARSAGADLPRRLVYVVDRRAVVDQATEEAERIREHARKHFGDDSLKISTLRGRHLDNRE
ncbi:MAG: type I-U CRISPR-associated helicase/endonuclease Cas3, partial [Alphaproteobacteria bacterium]